MKPAKPTHTPTPLKAEGARIYGSEGDVIALCHKSGAHNAGDDVANAAFIVRAVNAHEELVSLLKNWLSGDYMGDSQFRERAKQALDKLSA